MINNFFEQKKPVQLKFRRFEFKYRLPKLLADKILEDLLKYMTWDPFVSGKEDNAYQVSSLYFDNEGFSCYHDKVAGTKSRKKLRLRVYTDKENELSPTTPVFLEIKKKNDAVVSKDRLMLEYKDCGNLNDFFSSLLSKKAEVPYNEKVEDFFWLKNYSCFSPKVMVIYKRKPLVSKIDPGVRITFDSDIKTYPAKKLSFDKSATEVYPNEVIMELKYNNSIPYWFHRIVVKYQLSRVSFSKYCNSLEACNKKFFYV